MSPDYRTMRCRTPRAAYLGIALVIGLSCTSEPPTNEICETAQCRQDIVMKTWVEDQDRAMTILAELSDDVERIVAISKLVDLYPAEVGGLCHLLAVGHSKDRCELAARRDHLHIKPPRTHEPNRRSRNIFGGPLEDAPGYTSSLTDVEPDMGPCRDTPDTNGCLFSSALNHARKGNTRQAAALCKSIPPSGDPPDRWRSECFFEAAERRLKSNEKEGYRYAADLCRASGLYRRFCHKHLMLLMSNIAPPADTRSPAAWATLTRRTEVVRERWGSSPAGETLVSEFWAMALRRSMKTVDEVSGDVSDQVPAEAVPHVRAAAAARMMALGHPGVLHLQEWVAIIETALARRFHHRTRTMRRQKLKPILRIWPHWDVQDASLTVISYGGSAYRLLADDPKADIAICVLEAAGRLDPVPMSLLVEGSTHPDPHVQWTANMLIKWLESGPNAEHLESAPPSNPPEGLDERP